MLSIRSNVEPVSNSELPLLITFYGDVTYVEVAAATIICYDTITTFDKEVKYFWSAPRKTASIVYFLNRYIGIFTVLIGMTGYSSHISLELCIVSTWVENAGDWMTIVLIDYILLMRVLALWSEPKKLALCLRVIFAVESACMLGITICITVMQELSIAGAAGLSFCIGNSEVSPVLETTYWTAPFVFELLLMVLALYKAADFWRASTGVGGINLIKVLLQDQVLYFVLIMVCSATNIAFFWMDQLDTFNSATNIVDFLLSSATFPCIIGCRLLVHLSEAAERGVNGGTSYRIETTSEMLFA